MTVNWQLATLPESSTNVYVTRVGPMRKKESGSCDLVSSLSVPETSMDVGSRYVTVAPGLPSSTTTLKSAGHPRIVGGVVSTKDRDEEQT